MRTLRHLHSLPAPDCVDTGARTDTRSPQLETDLSRYVLTQLADNPQRRLEMDTPLFETLLDSTSVLALVGYLEERYAIEIGDAEIVPANFSTLRLLAAYLRRKTQTAVAPLAATG